jgi:hypothetical protein
MKKHTKHSKVKSKKKMPSKKVKNGSTVKAVELLRETMNLIAVYKKEAMRDATTRIDPDTADELMEKLQQVAKSL